jgi:hypothetical protein
MSTLRVELGSMGEDEIWFLNRPSMRAHRKVVLIKEGGA